MIFGKRVLVHRLLGAVLVFSALSSGARGESTDVIADVENEEPAEKETKVKYSQRIGIHYLIPTFSEINGYAEFYGPESGYIMFASDTFFYGRQIGLGMRFQFGAYQDKGNAASSASTSSFEPSEIVTEDGSELSLSMLPVRLGLIASATPFSAEWIAVSVSGGLQYTFVEEARLVDDSEELFVNRTHLRSIFVTPELLISIRGLDSPTGGADTLNITNFYISAFLDLLTPINSDGKVSGSACDAAKRAEGNCQFALGGSQIGLGFTFQML